MIINIAIVVLVHSGGIKVNIGDLTQGQVVALYNYMSQILVELIKLANLLVTITKALACADRIKSVFEQESTLEHNDNKSNSDSYIEFKLKTEIELQVMMLQRLVKLNLKMFH